MLGTFPNPLCNRATITITAPLSTVCPFDHTPDESKIVVSYQPGASCIELAAFKSFLAGFANQEISHEEVVQRIYEQVKEATGTDYISVDDTFVKDGMTLTVAILDP